MITSADKWMKEHPNKQTIGWVIEDICYKIFDKVPQKLLTETVETMNCEWDVPNLTNHFCPLQDLKIYQEIQLNPVSKWTKSNLASNSDELVRFLGVFTLLLQQINRGTLNNLVINSPLERLSYYLTWQIDSSSDIQRLTSASLSQHVCSHRAFFFYHLLFRSTPPPPEH